MSALNPIGLNDPLYTLTPTAGANSSANIAIGYGFCVVTNKGPGDVFMKSSSASSTTAATGQGSFVIAGSVQSFSIKPTDASIAAICPSGGTATVYVQTGEGE